MTTELDETFLQECLAELRDGHVVTIQVRVSQRHKVCEALRKMGATESQLDRLLLE